MKILECMDGTKIRRVSKWIKIRETWNPRKNNRLYDYADDVDIDGRELLWFMHKGRKYALNQFVRASSMWASCNYFTYGSGTNDSGIICGYDATDYYKPLLIEIDDVNDYIRLYEYV